MRPTLFLKVGLSALAIGLAAPSLTGEAAMAQTITSYEQQKIDDAMRSPKLAERPDLFDGQRFVPGTDLREANRYMNDFIRASNRAVQTFNGLTSSAQNSASGEVFLAFVNANAEKARAMQADWPRFEEEFMAAAEERARLEVERARLETRKRQREAELRSELEAERRAREKALQQAQSQADAAGDNDADVEPAPEPAAGDDTNGPACKRFREQVQRGGNSQRMRMLRAALAGEPVTIGDVSEVANWRAFAGEIQQACDAAGPEVTEASCADAYEDDSQPARWCADVQRIEDAIRAMVIAEVASRIDNLTRYNIQSVDDFLGREGWITKQGARTFDALFDPAGAINDDARGQIEAILAEIRLTLEDVSGEVAQSTGKLGELRAAVLEYAPQWELPFRAGENYSAELAASMLSRGYGGESNIRMKDVWLSRTEWKVHKNALGIPDRRTLPGYALVRVKADPEGLCQLRSFTLTEHFDGTGYQKAGRVQFGYTRFHRCP